MKPMLISMEQLAPYVEDGVTEYSVEASALRLHPSEWPNVIIALWNTGGDGGFRFESHHSIYLDGKFCGYEYRAADGTKLSVYND